jgi:hypothetical protein
LQEDGRVTRGAIDASSSRVMIATDQKRTATEGFGFGVLAGVILLAAEMVATGPAAPLRMAASLVSGFHALDSSLGTTYLVGLVVHLLLAGIFGLVYGELDARLPDESRRHYGIEIGIAAGYAALLWLGTELAAKALYPWFLTSAPLVRLVAMVLFYGVPLGVMFAAAKRRMPQLIKPSVG